MLKAVLIPRAVRCESFFVILNAANHVAKLEAMHKTKQREVYILTVGFVH